MADDIKKIGEPVPSRHSKTTGLSEPAGDVGVPTRKTPAKSVPGKGVNRPLSYSVPAVKEMQQAIINFAEQAAASDITSMTRSPAGEYGAQSRLAPEDMPEGRSLETKQEYLGGSEPFGNFLIQQYLGKTDPKGRQYLNVDLATPERGHQSIENINLRGVIDTIRRIGTPGAEKNKPDGVWKSRTNNAIKNIYALTRAAFNFSKDLGFHSKNYTEKTLQDFENSIPKEYTELRSSAELAERAKILTSHINAAADFFGQFKNAVVNSKQLRPYIEQTKSFVQYPKATGIPSELQQYQYFGLPGIKFDWITDQKKNWISLHDLSSSEAFKQFVHRVGIDDRDPQSIKKIFDLVYNKIMNTAGPGY